MKFKILVVDDDKPCLDSISRTLRSFFPHYTILTAANTADALRLIIEEGPDVCLFEADMNAERDLGLYEKYLAYHGGTRPKRGPAFIAHSTSPEFVQVYAGRMGYAIDQVVHKVSPPEIFQAAVLAWIWNKTIAEQEYLTELHTDVLARYDEWKKGYEERAKRAAQKKETRDQEGNLEL